MQADLGSAAPSCLLAAETVVQGGGTYNDDEGIISKFPQFPFTISKLSSRLSLGVPLLERTKEELVTLQKGIGFKPKLRGCD